MQPRLTVIILMLGMLAGAVGCGYTYPSAAVPEAAAPAPRETESVPLETFHDIVSRAVTASREEDRFWYTGWIASFVGKRQVNSMFDGTVYAPGGYIANVRVVGNPLRVVRWNGELFIEERDSWRRAGTVAEVFDPFTGFEELFASASDVATAGTEPVLGVPCLVYEGRLDPAVLADGPGERGEQALDSDASFRLWIEEERGRIMQFTVDIGMGLPGMGVLGQEVFFRFYRYGDPAIEPIDVGRIERYLRED